MSSGCTPPAGQGTQDVNKLFAPNQLDRFLTPGLRSQCLGQAGRPGQPTRIRANLLVEQRPHAVAGGSVQQRLAERRLGPRRPP
jgi:hypothetical protein